MESGHDTLDNDTPTDIFCNLQLNDPSSGNLVMFGGDVYQNGRAQNFGNPDIVEFDAVTRDLSSLPGMNLPRWYGSGVTLPDGRMYIQGGLNGEAFPEVWDPVNGAQALNLDTTELYWYYPRLFVIPDGRIFGFDTNGRMFTINEDLTTLTQHGKFAVSGVVGDGSSAVQYAPGKIIQFGGRSNHTYYFDLNGPTPEVTRGPNMSARRSWVDAVLLPDGRVLAIGGSGVKNELNGAKTSAEIWDPETGVWTEYAMGDVARLYHSTALLLPDASVLVAGGGAPGPLVNANAEIYYLVTQGGGEPPRPGYSLGSTEFDVGDAISLTSGQAADVTNVRLIKNGSVTHSFNAEQRLIELPFTRNGNSISATIPESSSVVTPGSYLLFLIGAAGVPSEAEIINIDPSDNVGPIGPTPPDPPDPGEPPGPPPVLRECTLRRENGGVTLEWNAAAGTNVRKNGSWAGKFAELTWFDPTGVAADFYVVVVTTQAARSVRTASMMAVPWTRPSRLRHPSRSMVNASLPRSAEAIRSCSAIPTTTTTTGTFDATASGSTRSLATTTTSTPKASPVTRIRSGIGFPARGDRTSTVSKRADQRRLRPLPARLRSWEAGCASPGKPSPAKTDTASAATATG